MEKFKDERYWDFLKISISAQHGFYVVYQKEENQDEKNLKYLLNKDGVYNHFLEKYSLQKKDILGSMGRLEDFIVLSGTYSLKVVSLWEIPKNYIPVYFLKLYAYLKETLKNQFKKDKTLYIEYLEKSKFIETLEEFKTVFIEIFNDYIGGHPKYLEQTIDLIDFYDQTGQKKQITTEILKDDFIDEGVFI